MAAKKHPARHSKAVKRKPSQGRHAIGEQLEGVPTTAGDAVPLENEPKRFVPPVAGIGMSAGGLEALKKLFSAMPPNTGVAFVLVPHLDPVHESLMVELLAPHTMMPVIKAKSLVAVEANHVYVIPPNKYMTIHDGVLRLTGPVERRDSPTTIDLFLRSLADDQQEHSICILLSGTGSHGSLGLKAIKAAGGMAMVQDPLTAEYGGMPQSAIATGLADYILPPEQMPDALFKYVQHAYVNGAQTSEAPEVTDSTGQVLALLRARTKFDFRCYRKKVITRRIERRMGLNHFGSIKEYLPFLREHPDELKQLVKDLFISVTSFFRDPEAFEQLATQVLLPVVQSKEADATIRVWVPGCATGEEAYSIAILLLEQLAAAQKNCRLQIFATDVDRDALEVARQGIYPDSIAVDLSPGRLARFFTKASNHTYQVSKQLRETVLFAVHNLIGDAPFSKLDLVSCRNVLIYLESDVQKKVISLFHFALNEGAGLFLGSSETIGSQIDLFESLSKKWHIFRHIGPRRLERVDFPIGTPTDLWEIGRHRSAAVGSRTIGFAEMTHQLLLEQYAPAAVLINRNYEILYYFGRTALYLELPTGVPTNDVTSMAREGLRTKLRGAVHRAIRQNQRVELENVPVRRDTGQASVRVAISPVKMPNAPEGLLLITFEEDNSQPAGSQTPARKGELASNEDVLRQLEHELKATREELQSTIEEMESSNEELKSSNEEVMSMNEELQSSNEELESSKEELQSLNEETNTVNSQLQEKVAALERANNDTANLLNCTDIATLFLSPDFRIKLFTPASLRLFHLIPSDVGRHFADIQPRFSDPQLLSDAQRVLKNLIPREKEILSTDNTYWARRVVPYRTTDNRIDGVVITFLDVTARRQATLAAQRLAAIVEGTADAIFSKDLEGNIQTWNRGAQKLYDYSEAEAVGQSSRMLVPADRLDEWKDLMARLARGEYVEQLETERVRKDGQRVAVALTMSPLRDKNGKLVSVIVRDITEGKKAQSELRDREGRLAAILSTAADAIITFDRHGRIETVNHAAEKMFGYAAPEMIGQNVSMLVPPTYSYEHDIYLRQSQETGQARVIGRSREIVAQRRDGSVFPVDLAVSEVEHLEFFVGVYHDLSNRKQLQKQILEISADEQRRIGQELHDGTQQELTGLSLIAGALLDDLHAAEEQHFAERSVWQFDKASYEHLCDTTMKLCQRLAEANRHVQQLARGIMPVQVDAEGLRAALGELAASTDGLKGITCRCECAGPVKVANITTATHLYRIAQEAVNNAVRHSHASEILIRLDDQDGHFILEVRDNGSGFDTTATSRMASTGKGPGMGLRIMEYRAGLIGGTLQVERQATGGTSVKCEVLRGG